jgi:hypothetical protein
MGLKRRAGRVLSAVLDVRVLAAVLALSSAGTALNFILIGGVLAKQGEQSKQGQQARERQCQLAPVALKVYENQHRQGVITRADLALLRGGLPARCLK